jgi:hypothetical protein
LKINNKVEFKNDDSLSSLTRTIINLKEIVMLEIFRKLFGLEKTDYAQLVNDGAIILDVRTTGEF